MVRAISFVLLFSSVLLAFGSDPKVEEDPPTNCVGLTGRLNGCQVSMSPTLTKSELIPELNSNSTYKPLLDVLRAARLATSYFETNFESVNLDGIIAARITQGQLQVTQKNLESFAEVQKLSSKAKQALNEDITNLRNSLADIINSAGHRLKISSKEYYEQMEPLFKSQWIFDYPTRVTNPSYIYQTDNLATDFDEPFSDSCYSEIIGTNENAGKPCSPSEKCWAYQTAPNTKGYKLTHEILYLLITVMFSGCTDAINELIKKEKQVSTANLIDTFCANVLQEMKNESSGDIWIGNRDLFMEQSFMCGMMGFRDFASIAWLNSILSWQKPEGCYGPKDSTEVVNYLAYQANKIIGGSSVVLEKRVEQVMDNWCLSHQTGIALSALAVYLRFLLEDSSLTFAQ